jgi:hypothetical protein
MMAKARQNEAFKLSVAGNLSWQRDEAGRDRIFEELWSCGKWKSGKSL